MTGGIFKKDESALRQAEQKPRLHWGRDVWIAVVACNHLNLVLSDPKADHGRIIGAYLLAALAAAILIFRMWRRIRQHRNQASDILGAAKQRDQP
ncbi:hypothetical protein QEV83_14480 [Methylocapsa sp. D3K7]|uniref:hypothetical protein n=1 Tax=Methylocapsa sp. D3K7 TaxID=3041435 RepID=UPI00244ECAE6|nr:hypothetical protein [Methylocapsa sp. D3K7]WGJ13867.1 hypothetical protein QEV83_14480 [Methylocapsa sp. D3K7]